MTTPIVQSSESVTLIGGGKATSDELEEALSLAPRLVAVDGGADTALRFNRMPEAVIGDMDSLSRQSAKTLSPDRLHRIAEQDTTDFEKALRSLSCPHLIGVGFLGGRLDHELANLSTLHRFRRCSCVLIGPKDIVFAAPKRLSIELQPGTRVSLFPMEKIAGNSRGLAWPINGIEFSPNGRVGTSNRVSAELAGKVGLEFDQPGMLVILPRDTLRSAVAALTGEPQSAPAR